MKPVYLIARLLTGAVFIFSGTVKAIDPVGSAIKFTDYFTAFGLEFMIPLSMPLAFLLCLAEFLSGFALLSGIRYHAGLTGATALMALFTPLTFVLAVLNPVSDCGCFGDAIKMTNWETFGKNVIISFFVLILITRKQKPSEYLKAGKGRLILFLMSILFISFTFYNLIFLPVIDFLPYKKGNNIRELMIIPEGAPAPLYRTTFIYEKNGIRKEFTLENYPADDTAWKFIDQKSVMIRKGYEPPIHDFTITTADGRNLTDHVLDNKGYTLLMVSHKLEKADPGKLTKGFAAGRQFTSAGMEFYVLTSTGSDKLKNYENGLEFCLADETTLKTMVRSNPGYLLLQNGTVAGKWSWASLPSDINKIIK